MTCQVALKWNSEQFKLIIINYNVNISFTISKVQLQFIVKLT